MAGKEVSIGNCDRDHEKPTTSRNTVRFGSKGVQQRCCVLLGQRSLILLDVLARKDVMVSVPYYRADRTDVRIVPTWALVLAKL